MSECIVRMEMPTSCKKCKNTICLWVKDDDLDYMDVIEKVQDFRKKNNDVGFPDFCPITCALPEGHGRLVDADKLEDDMKARKAFFGRKSDPQCLVEDAATIVPADASDAVTPTDTPTDTPTVTAERSET